MFIGFRWWSIPATAECADYVRPEDRRKPTAELDLANMLGVFIVLLSCVCLSVLIEISNRVMSLINGRRKAKQ